jgi:hypothetical protein
MANVDRSYNQVRSELAQVGLLADGVYLDKVELCISDEKSGDGVWGYVFERVGHFAEQGYREGVIYLPRDLPNRPYVPGLTLTDTIRHEYAHAWFCMDSGLFKRDWFARTFGAAYSNQEPVPYLNCRKKIVRSTEFQADQESRATEAARQELYNRYLRMHFISDYATTNSSEDFAETFMYYLKYRRTLGRFASRPLVYQKLKMVQQIVGATARRLRLSGSRSIRYRSA